MTPKPIQTLSPDAIAVTFDGNECVYSGPSEIEIGAYKITVRNTSGLLGWARICRSDEGYVWQDILNHDFSDDEDADDDIEWPSWCWGRPSESPT